ncbi:MAG TPA: CapA family protein [Treponemataceae bacterium]|nr:CapA family protein [Treponemataceae bacterium]
MVSPTLYSDIQTVSDTKKEFDTFILYIAKDHSELSLEEKKAKTIAFIHEKHEASAALQKTTKTNPYTPQQSDLFSVHGKTITKKVLDTTIIYPSIPFSNTLTTYSSVLPKVTPTHTDIVYSKFEQIPSTHIALPQTMFSTQENKSTLLFANNPNYSLLENKVIIYSELQPQKSQFYQKKARAAAFTQAQLVFKTLAHAISIPEHTVPHITYISAVGDMILSRGVDYSMIYAKSPKPVFTTTLDVLTTNDITIGNLECVVTNRTENAEKTYTFKGSKKALPYLKEAGFNYLMVTNNHSYDYGEDGFKDTLKALEKHGIHTSGAGTTLKKAQEFYRTVCNDLTIAILSCGAFPIEKSGFDGKKTATATDDRAGILWEGKDFLNLVAQEKQNDSYIIINVHGGEEYTSLPSEKQKKLYKQLCDHGADIVFGSHPHVVQPVELYNKSLIAYSLGNFVFPGMDEMHGAEDSIIIRVGIANSRILYYEKYPCILDQTTVRLAESTNRTIAD